MGGHKNRHVGYRKDNKELKRGDYVKVKVDYSHPQADKYGYVFEHILVAENAIGRYLGPDESVHHLNHIRNDNRPENLVVVTDKDHEWYHKHG